MKIKKLILTALMICIALHAVELGNGLPILLPMDAQPLEKTAAAELSRYLQEMTGSEFPVLTAETPGQQSAIVIGSLVPEVPNEKLGPDGFVVRIVGEQLHIAGGSPRGTIYGVYDFLEHELGARWWSWNEEEIPKHETITLTELDRRVTPAFYMHHLFNREAENPTNHFVWKGRGKGYEEMGGGHTLCPLLKPYAEAQPEFLPMDKDGKRSFNNLHMCYTAPGMAKALAEALEKTQIAKHKDALDRVIIFAGMGDWYGGMCQCERCKAVYEAETWTDPDGRRKPGYSATLLRMINETAGILKSKYPEIRLGTFAYMSIESPPATVKPADNVVIWMPHLRHCIVHGVDECEKNQSFYRDLVRWTELAPERVYIWDYGVSFANFLYAFPNLHSIAQNLKVYHQLGVRGVMIQGNYVSMGSDMIALKNDVWSRLMWEPEADVDALVAAFCHGYYGPAGDAMIAYVSALRDSVRGADLVHFNEFEKGLLGKWLDEDEYAELQDMLKKALVAAGDRSPYDRRVHEAKAGMDALKLWTPSPVKEQADRLVRVDLGDTWADAEALITYSRDASPAEWGVARPYQMGFLTWHGGPLVTLTQDDLQVNVAPILNGRIRRLRWKGEDLLAVPGPDDKAPNKWGAAEALQPFSRLYRMVDEPTTASVTMEAELGVANWSSNTKLVARKTVELMDGQTIRISGRGRPGDVKQGELKTTLVTAWLAGRDIAAIRTEYRDSDGIWQPATMVTGPLDPEKAAPNLPAHHALRISLQAKNVTITDGFAQPAEHGFIWLEPETGVLVIRSVLPAVSVTSTESPTYMERTIRIQRATTEPE